MMDVTGSEEKRIQTAHTRDSDLEQLERDEEALAGWVGKAGSTVSWSGPHVYSELRSTRFVLNEARSEE